MNGALLALAVLSASPQPRAPSPSAATAAEALPFIEDDYGRALAEAKAKKLPLFVDVWAPW